ncbi:Endoglucanase EG-II [Cytospora mali]|uniref:Endoglucanase EG-II n=1 Tax=Cytospora mali TaxID=578113 RepID=A0A194W7Q4_CYTMA|nr:Endoglucanase EG-II [Valsa mali]
MPCAKKSSTLSSALTAATAALSSIYSVSTPITTSSSAITTTSTSSAAGPSLAEPTGTPVIALANTNSTLYAGVSISGLDFGCDSEGSCTVGGVTVPSNAADQMQHFVSKDSLNIFRLTVGWQYLTNNVVGGNLDSSNFGTYDDLMQSCLATGSKCVIDIHNYARWNGKIIGQGGPSNDEFAALWTSLATKYSNNTDVIFAIMNEPHDCKSTSTFSLTVSTWADTVQAAVTAIRQVAPDHMILIPGSSYSSAGELPNEAGPYLLNVTNPDGSTDNIHFDVHKYLDSDNSGTAPECVTNNIDDAFDPLATWLRDNKRKAMVSETGGGNTDSCEKFVCEELAYLNQNNDVYLGYIGWAAGAFDSSYALSLTPTGNTAADFVDTELMTQCFSRA